MKVKTSSTKSLSMAESIFGPELLRDARPLVLPCAYGFEEPTSTS